MKIYLVQSFVFFIMLFSVSSKIQAKTINTVAETESLAKEMMSYYIKKEFKQGMAVAKPHWPLPQVELDNLIKKIETQWPVLDKRFGDAVGFELVKTESIGTSFIRYYYLHKFKNHAIYWRISFYKPLESWVVNGVSFRDTLDVLYK